MKSAKKMFEELGYKQEIEERFIVYEKKNKDIYIFIEFCLEEKDLNKTKVKFGEAGIKALSINMSELQAINKQCKELDWTLEEKEE